MTYGIAAYKVTPEFCEEEVRYITSIGGIDIKYNQQLGKDFQLEDLQNNFAAVFLGIGVGIARKLDISGENSLGVEDAISYIHNLRTSNLSEIPVGDKVVVIGLGMTAIDAATQVKRLGAKDVTIVYRRTENEKPCTDVELDIAKLDDCNLEYLAVPKEISSENGNIKSLICSRMKLGETDASGRRSPVETGETFEIECDMIIKAAGQTPYDNLISANNVENIYGKVSINPRYQTNLPGVFAGGDCISGGKEVVNAAQDGKLAARSILEYIMN
jgi:dihydropyrimidine dehydrogenase (NAD+) subunit PreT